MGDEALPLSSVVDDGDEESCGGDVKVATVTARAAGGCM